MKEEELKQAEQYAVEVAQHYYNLLKQAQEIGKDKKEAFLGKEVTNSRVVDKLTDHIHTLINEARRQKKKLVEERADKNIMLSKDTVYDRGMALKRAQAEIEKEEKE